MQNKIETPQYKNTEDYIYTKYLLQSLIEKKYFIFIIGIIFLILSLTCATFMPKKYQSSILLKIQHRQQNILGNIPGQSSLAGNIPEDPLTVQIALIRSEFILRPVIKSLGLDIDIATPNKKKQEYEVLNQIYKNLSITDLSASSDNSNNKVAILRVSLVGKNPLLITRILNQVAITIQQQNTKLKTQEIEKTLQYLKQQLPIVQFSLKKAEKNLNNYRAINGRIDIKFQTEYLLNHLSEVNQQLEKIRLKKINLLQTYTIKHPFVIALDQELHELKKRQYELINQLKKLPDFEQEAMNFKREVEVQNNIYMILLNQIRQLEVINTSIISDVQILSYASAPYLLQNIHLSIIGFFGLTIGLIFGCLAILIWIIFSHQRSHQFGAALFSSPKIIHKSN